MLGCGNSALGEAVSPALDMVSRLISQMYDAGWLDIVNIDVSFSKVAPPGLKLRQQYSKRVIEDMKERHISREKMQWLEMDILDLQFEDGSFDLVIDKGKHDYIYKS